jgi:tetratricopeptide (TPR) repeat protein
MSNKTLPVNLALNKARTLARNGAKVQAAQIYRAVLKKFPGNKRAVKGLKTLERSRPTQERLVLNTGPTQEQINGLIGLYERGQLQAALKQGTALAGQYPNAPMIQYILGVVNAVAGRKEEAVTSLTKALRIKPDYAKAHENLGRIKKYEPGDPQIAQNRDTISDRKISENEEMLLRFALGKAYDDIGDTENSFPSGRAGDVQGQFGGMAEI